MSRARATAGTRGTPVPTYRRSDLEAMFLPVKQMLQIDRVTEINDERLVCEIDIAGHWVFKVHFPADPIFPGTLLVEAAGQALAIWAWNAGFRGRPRLGKVAARFFAPVLPEHENVRLVATIRHRNCVFAGLVECFVCGQRVAEIEPVVFIISQPVCTETHLAAANGH